MQVEFTDLLHLQRLERYCFATIRGLVVDSTMSTDDMEDNGSICFGGADSDAAEICSAWSSDDGASMPVGHVPSLNQEACMILILWRCEEYEGRSVMITYNEMHWEMTFQLSS